MAKKRNGKLSLTKKGEKYLDDSNLILHEVLKCLFYKFNWGYYDGYESEAIGNVIPGFSLYLLKKYGKKERPASFYAEKYFKAFPQLGGSIEDFRCYETQTMKRYFRFMGFVEERKREGFQEETRVEKTTFIDELFKLNI